MAPRQRPNTIPPEPAEPPAPDDLEARIVRTGDELLSSLRRVLDRLNGSESGPQRLARELGVDKVLASRLLKAVRSPDGMTAMHRAPGPEPIRRVLKASLLAGVPQEEIAAAEAATDAFEQLIETGTGDRTGLETMLSAWVPEARRDFELRRKQAAFRAMSQLKGVQTDVFAETAIFWPNKDGEKIDVVWIKCVIGLARLRPGVAIKFVSKRGVENPTGRHPLTLAGDPVDSVSNTVLPEFCTTPLPRLIATVTGEHTHYMVEDTRLIEPVRVVTCEVNIAEIPRYVPSSKGRRAWASSDIAIPAQAFQFDTLLHPDLYAGAQPDLRVYDTTIHGTADRNDPSRDIDQFDLLDRIDDLGTGLSRFGSSHVPQYRRLIGRVCEHLTLDSTILRGYRVSSGYPLYGAQYVMSFPTTER
ncbi:MAG TPA: hypothetical protein VG797_05250 [Phycisphaerales bacterium]|nr:hypothetical protein [Phycisphaerales bacterium]